MKVKRETIRIETFFKYTGEGKDEKLAYIERLAYVGDEIVYTQRMSSRMCKLDNSPIKHFLSWIKGLYENPEDYWKEVRATVDDRERNDSDKYAECDPCWKITLTEADRELIQKMIDTETKRLREEEKRKQEFLKTIEDAKKGKIFWKY